MCKIIKTTIFTIYFFLGCVVFCHAQNNYKQGYVITNEMDTIYGWIDYRTDIKNALECNFKKDRNSKNHTYFPGSIFGYRLINEGKFYISKTITINATAKMMFLEYLVQGIVDLYYLNDNGSEYYIFEDETGKMIAVTKKPDQYITNDRGITYLKVDNSYIGQVRSLYYNSNDAMKDIDHLRFTQQSMIDITKDYHRQMCTTGEDCVVFTGKPDTHYTLFNFSAYAGWQIFHDDFFGNIESPIIGGRMNIIVPRYNKYISFQLDISISKISGTYNENIDGNSYRYKFNQMMIPINYGFKYTFGKYKLRPSAELGGVFHANVHKTITEYMNNIETSHYPYGLGGEFGFYAGCGLDYEMKNNHSIFIGASIDIRSIIQFKLGYTW
jgi:hypothetical protein